MLSLLLLKLLLWFPKKVIDKHILTIFLISSNNILSTICYYFLLFQLRRNYSGTISDYEVMNRFHCGGDSIKTWDDGSSTNYGKLVGVSNCELMCNIHVECAGFVHRKSDDKCGYWKRAPLKPYFKIGASCHQKIKGSTISYM